MNKKIKRILLFHGTSVCNNTLNIFTDIVANELRKRDIGTGFIELYKDADSLLKQYEEQLHLGFDAALAFNSAGQQETAIDGNNIFNKLDIPFFNWIVDHPCEHIVDLDSKLNHYHIICLDRDHVKYINRYFPDIEGAHFIPIGGFETHSPKLSYESFLNREYDLIYTAGSYPLQKSIDKIRTFLPDNLQQVAFDMIDIMLDNRNTNNESALRLALEKNEIYAEDSDFKDYTYITSMTNILIRSYVREELIRYLAESGICMHIFGEGWDFLENKGNIMLHGGVSYEESVALCQNAKMSLNIMPWFKDGLHDRIPSAMLAGSAVLTDSSKYIEESFISSGEDQNILLFDIAHPEEVAPKIREALNNPSKLYQIANSGYKKASKELSWGRQVDKLLDILQQSIN